MDTKTKEERSRNMAAVKNKNTDLEITLRKALWAKGFRFRVRVKNKLPGKPDIVFPGKKIAIFCDGCFWHGCPRCRQIPDQNHQFWLDKIRRNKERDEKVYFELENMGWTVMRFWGCEIQKELGRIILEIENVMIEKS